MTNELFKDFPDVVTVGDLMKMLQIGRNTAYELIKTDTIHYVKVKNQIRIPKTGVIHFLEVIKKKEQKEFS